MHRSLALLAVLSVSFLTAACTMPTSEIDRELRASLDELERAGDSAVADLASLDPLAPAPRPAPTFAAKRKAYKASLAPKPAKVVTAPAPAVETPPAPDAAAIAATTPANAVTDPALPVLPPLK